MRGASLILPVALAGALSGCISHGNVYSIRKGMSKDQVIAIMGRPTWTRTAKDGQEVLTYYNVSEHHGYGTWRVTLANGREESVARDIDVRPSFYDSFDPQPEPLWREWDAAMP
jgi:outer membrane protein assembly factor BamE (lipoprotein component of BamABCDE complex)